jgi:hypothetical protein
MYAQDRAKSPRYFALEKVPADHYVYEYVEEQSGRMPVIRRIEPARSPLEVISDGTRALAILCHRDICRAWQARAVAQDELDFRLGQNICMFVTGGNSMARRLRPVFPTPKGQIKRTALIAWLEHEGNCHTQPYALTVVGEKLAAEESRIGLDVQRTPIAGLAGRKFDLAWMTGSDEFALKAQDLKDLKAYLDGGGTLFVNAVGGSIKFRDSARNLLDQLFKDDLDAASGTASSDSSFFTGVCGEYRGPIIGKTDSGGLKLARCKDWAAADEKATGSTLQVIVKGGRPVAIFCPYGIHDTLDGHTAAKAHSYMPATARDLAANIILTALMERPKVKPVPATAESQPASRPAEPATTSEAPGK